MWLRDLCRRWFGPSRATAIANAEESGSEFFSNG
jgi:hypothetical protein